MFRSLAIIVGLVVLSLMLVSCGGPSTSDAYQEGMQAAQSGDWDSARKNFDAAGNYLDARQQEITSQKNSATVSSAYNQGSQALDQQKWSDAYTQLKIVVQLAPNYKDASQKLNTAQQKLDTLMSEAETKQGSGDFAGAVDLLKQVGTYQNADSRAQTLSQLMTSLDQLYGQMTADVQGGDWSQVFSTVDNILSQAPTYRDVKEKRTEYLEQAYGQASTAMSQGDLPTAIKLFTIVVNAEPNYKDANQQLGVAQTQIKKAPVGVQTFNQDFPRRWDNLDATLQTIEVLSDSRLKVTIALKNNTASTNQWWCFATPLIDLHDEKKTVLAPKKADDFCQSKDHPTIEVDPGDTVQVWAILPAIPDATVPFDIDIEGNWGDWGQITDVTLVKIAQ